MKNTPFLQPARGQESTDGLLGFMPTTTQVRTNRLKGKHAGGQGMVLREVGVRRGARYHLPEMCTWFQGSAKQPSPD